MMAMMMAMMLAMMMAMMMAMMLAMTMTAYTQNTYGLNTNRYIFRFLRWSLGLIFHQCWVDVDANNDNCSDYQDNDDGAVISINVDGAWA